MYDARKDAAHTDAASYPLCDGILGTVAVIVAPKQKLTCHCEGPMFEVAIAVAIAIVQTRAQVVAKTLRE